MAIIPATHAATMQLFSPSVTVAIAYLPRPIGLRKAVMRAIADRQGRVLYIHFKDGSSSRLVDIGVA